jgi:SAM-dependent methyltransferase
LRRAAQMWVFKDSRFDEDELHTASSRPKHLLDAVLERYQPASFLDVGCGVGYGLQYVAAKGVESLGVEGSKAALAASPVPELIRLCNLNYPLDLRRKFDGVELRGG